LINLVKVFERQKSISVKTERVSVSSFAYLIGLVKIRGRRTFKEGKRGAAHEERELHVAEKTKDNSF